MRSVSRTIPAADGTPLHLDLWLPEGKPRRVVAVAHGGAEHAGRYARLAEQLTADGALVFGPDHRGFGSSGGTRGHVERFEVYTADLRTVMKDVAAGEAAMELPWFLYGHSMGGLISLLYLLDHQHQAPKLQGAVFSSPLLGLAMKVNPLKLALGKVAAALAPRLALPSGIPVDAISRDPEEVARYAADPRRVDVVTAGWFAAMNAAIARVEQCVGTIELPCLWYTGTGDRIVDHTAIERVFARIDAAGERDQTLRVFPGYYHELHNEPEELRVPIYHMIRAWLAERS